MHGKQSLSYFLLSLACMLFTLAFPTMAGATAVVAGQIEFVEGDVTIMNVGGQNRVPHADETLLEGDTISTGKDGELHARMADEGYIGVRPNTNLKVESYSAEATDLDNVVLSLIRGTFRSITGWVGRNNPQKYRINVGPVATIGVRGTDHEPAFIPDPLPGETPVGPPGAYDKVNSGKTFIQHPGGTIELGPNQSGFAARDPKIAPRLLSKAPEFYRPTKNESRIDRRKKEISTQIGKKHNERQQQTRNLQMQKAKAEHTHQSNKNEQKQRQQKQQEHKAKTTHHPRLHRNIHNPERPGHQ